VLADGLRRSYLVAALLAAGLALLFAAGLAAAGRALERAREVAARTERLADLGAMAALVAHEVRNPLGTLRGQVELLGERLGGDAPPRERERIAEMLEEIDRVTAVTDELLTLGREGALAREPVSLAQLAAGVVARVARSRPAARLENAVADGLTVTGDPGKLEQALFNLVLNAAQIGGDGVNVRIAAAESTETITLSIADDGPGISPAVGARLFEPFVTGRAEGRGLGLAVARFVAERHGGRLELAPTPPGGRGAVFLLRLPR
jgi:signal transduction histidine kinase